MCGRFAFFSPREAVLEYFAEEGLHIAGELTAEPSYNIAPGRDIAAIAGWPEPAFTEFHWGLVPKWAKDPSIGNRMINARAETLREKPSFKAPLRHGRCLLLADGYYEWQKTEDSKLPWFFAARDRHPMLLAGLMDTWRKGEQPLQTATIITTVASAEVAPVHHRMPIVLDPVSARLWLDTRTDEPTVDRLLQTQCDVIRWPVSRAVNNPANDMPELLDDKAAGAGGD